MNLATNTQRMAPASAELPVSGHIFPPAASKGLVVRLAVSHDAAAIARIGREGFSLAHRDAFKPEDLESILDNTYNPGAVLQEIRDRQKRLFVAEINGDVVGIVRLRPGAAPVNLPARHPVELTWMYLSPQAIGKGVGSALMSRAVEQARAEGVDVLWLTVWTSNQRAIPFYKRWGFRVAGMNGVAVGHSRPVAYIMAQTINQPASLQ
jgi:diamine N-acetyltransferase